MNSMSKPVYHDDSCGCKKVRVREADTILKCKTGFPLTITEDVTTGTTFTLNTITVKTGHFSNPCFKFEFASNIITDTTTSTLSFQIFKLCKNQTVPTPIGPAWLYDTVASTGAESFTFVVCDCDCDCDCEKEDCCVYSVVVTAVSTEIGTTIINNPTFSILVVDNQFKC